MTTYGKEPNPGKYVVGGQTLSPEQAGTSPVPWWQTGSDGGPGPGGVARLFQGFPGVGGGGGFGFFGANPPMRRPGEQNTAPAAGWPTPRPPAPPGGGQPPGTGFTPYTPAAGSAPGGGVAPPTLSDRNMGEDHMWQQASPPERSAMLSEGYNPFGPGRQGGAGGSPRSRWDYSKPSPFQKGGGVPPGGPGPGGGPPAATPSPPATSGGLLGSGLRNAASSVAGMGFSPTARPGPAGVSPMSRWPGGTGPSFGRAVVGGGGMMNPNWQR
jgi:hypothetical protein